jgi:hypothetical protein
MLIANQSSESRAGQIAGKPTILKWRYWVVLYRLYHIKPCFGVCLSPYIGLITWYIQVPEKLIDQKQTGKTGLRPSRVRQEWDFWNMFFLHMFTVCLRRFRCFRLCACPSAAELGGCSSAPRPHRHRILVQRAWPGAATCDRCVMCLSSVM